MEIFQMSCASLYAHLLYLRHTVISNVRFLFDLLILLYPATKICKSGWMKHINHFSIAATPKWDNHHVLQATFHQFCSHSAYGGTIWHICWPGRKNRTRVVMNVDVNSHLALSGCGRTTEEAKSAVGPLGEPGEKGRVIQLDFLNKKWYHYTTHTAPSSAHVHTWDRAYTNSVVLISKQFILSVFFQINVWKSPDTASVKWTSLIFSWILDQYIEVIDFWLYFLQTLRSLIPISAEDGAHVQFRLMGDTWDD